MKSTIGTLPCVWSLCVLSMSACQWSSEYSSGLPSLIRVEGGQARRGSISEPATTISATASFFPKYANVFPGVSNKAVKGVVGPDANAVAMGVDGDQAYWLVPALDPDSSDMEHAYRYTATLSLSPALTASPLLQANPDGTLTLPLSIRAVDESGSFGPTMVQTLFMDSQEPVGTLIVSLDWDAPVDLDLHVQVPADNDDGFVVVWAKARSAGHLNPDGLPKTPDGVLDFDSNAGCQIDGRGREYVVWTGEPPSGHYIVRVDAFSLCGHMSAAWHAVAYSDLDDLGEASGVFTDTIRRKPPTADSGLTAFEFDYP
jgi:hypothetical protein